MTRFWSDAGVRGVARYLAPLPWGEEIAFQERGAVVP